MGQLTYTTAQIQSKLDNFLGNYTFSTLPSVSANANRLAFVTDIGVTGSLWRSNGTIWHPVDNVIIFAKAAGTLTTPLATLSSVTEGDFTLSGGNIIIPANLCKVGSIIEAEATFRKNGTASTWGASIRISTNLVAGSTTDNSTLAGRTATNVTGGFTRLLCKSYFTSATALLANGVGNANTDLGSGSTTDRTEYINTAAQQKIFFAIRAGHASDTYQLISYEVRLTI